MTDIDMLEEYGDIESDQDYRGDDYTIAPATLYIHPAPMRIAPSDLITFATYEIPISIPTALITPVAIVNRKENGVASTIRISRVDGGSTAKLWLFARPEDFTMQGSPAIPYCPYGYGIFTGSTTAPANKTETFTTKSRLWLAATDATNTGAIIVSVATELFNVA